MTGRERADFLRNLAGLRFALTAVGVAVATLLTWATGAETVVVEGTLITGVALLLTLTQQTYAIPLSARLRLGIVSGLELLKQAILTGAILVLVAPAQTCCPSSASVVSALAVLVATLIVVSQERVPIGSAHLSAVQ